MTELGVPQYENALDRLFRKSIPEPNTGCWLWEGALTDGYGNTEYRRTKIKAHRFAYELLKGSIPIGMQIDHLCRMRCCVNPDHMEIVTQRMNARRGRDARPYNTHCKNGHELSGDNLSQWRDKDGGLHRRCLICHAALARENRRRQRQQ